MTTQVIERHIVHGLEDLFSPTLIANMLEEDIEVIASEPATIKKYRATLRNNVEKLNEARELLREIVRTTAQD